ncbi:MAG: glycosyltransferase [Aphanocapsa lilacina HA4352-LM1]|jgi:glycosyltransferase involved in cell wall biosynthesis|nr:glycosyltransferase [Aphanocapsa lilacina HA4352-LM1]
MKPGEPLISIVVAALNRENTIQSCIDSVVAQTYKHWELVIVDGGSTDKTVEIIRDNRMKIGYWHTQKDKGIYDAWNKALSKASGDYICFLGADDTFSDERSLQILAERTHTQVDLVSGQVLFISKEGKKLKKWGEPWNWSRLKRHMVVAHPGMLHRKDLFKTHGVFNTEYKIAGDYEFLLRLGSKVNSRYVDAPIVHMSPGGISNRRPMLAIRENLQIQRNHPEISEWQAWVNFTTAALKVIPRKLLEVIWQWIN